MPRQSAPKFNFPKLPAAAWAAIGVILAALCSSPVLIAIINQDKATPAPTATLVNTCDFTVDEIVLGKSIIETGQAVAVSVGVNNPNGQPLLYNWASIYGDMQPGLNSTSFQSTYTAPPQPGQDTISIKVSAPGCSVTKKMQITIINNTSPAASLSSSTPTFVRNGDCEVKLFTASPPSPVSYGQEVALSGNGDCNGGVRAVRFIVDGQPKAETMQKSQVEIWKTGEFLVGKHTVCFQVVGGINNTDWKDAAESCLTYEVK